MTRREIIKMKGESVYKVLRRIKTAGESLKGPVTIAERRVTWQKLVSQRKKSVESNVAASKSEDEWDAKALLATEEEELAFKATISKQVDYEKD